MNKIPDLAFKNASLHNYQNEPRKHLEEVLSPLQLQKSDHSCVIKHIGFFLIKGFIIGFLNRVSFLTSNGKFDFILRNFKVPCAVISSKFSSMERGS